MTEGTAPLAPAARTRDRPDGLDDIPRIPHGDMPPPRPIRKPPNPRTALRAVRNHHRLYLRRGLSAGLKGLFGLRKTVVARPHRVEIDVSCPGEVYRRGIRVRVAESASQ